MSLDVYLTIKNDLPQRQRIPIRERGQMKEITIEEWNERFPDREPIAVDVPNNEVFTANITHNLSTMAAKAGIYKPLWRPDEIGITKAAQLIEPLTEGIAKLENNPDHFRQFNPSNGWGSYEVLVSFVYNYLKACKNYPSADVSVWR